MKIFTWFTNQSSNINDSFSNPYLPEKLNIYFTTEPLSKNKERSYIQINLSTLLKSLQTSSPELITCSDILQSYHSQFQNNITNLYSPSKSNITDFSFFLIDKSNETTQLYIPLTYTPFQDLFKTTNELFFLNAKHQFKYMEDRAYEIIPLFEPQNNLHTIITSSNDDSPPQQSKTKIICKDVISDNCLFLYRKKLVWLEEKITLDDKRIRYTFQGMENYTEIENIKTIYFGMKKLRKIEPNLEKIVNKKERGKIFGIAGPKTTCIFIIKNKYSQFEKRLKEFKLTKNEQPSEQEYNNELQSKKKSIGTKAQNIINSIFYNEQYISYEFYRNYFSLRISNKVYADLVESILEYKKFHKENNFLCSWILTKKLLSLMKSESTIPIEDMENKTNRGSLIPVDKIEKLNNILINCDESSKFMRSRTPEDMQEEFNKKLQNILTFELFDEIIKCIYDRMKELECFSIKNNECFKMGKYILMYYFLRQNKCLGFVSIKNNLAKKNKYLAKKNTV